MLIVLLNIRNGGPAAHVAIGTMMWCVRQLLLLTLLLQLLLLLLLLLLLPIEDAGGYQEEREHGCLGSTLQRGRRRFVDRDCCVGTYNTSLGIPTWVQAALAINFLGPSTAARARSNRF